MFSKTVGKLRITSQWLLEIISVLRTIAFKKQRKTSDIIMFGAVPFISLDFGRCVEEQRKETERNMKTTWSEIKRNANKFKNHLCIDTGFVYRYIYIYSIL